MKNKELKQEIESNTTNEVWDSEPATHSFCETPEEKCTMNYCDENGCMNRNRNLLKPKQLKDAEIDTKQEERLKSGAARDYWFNKFQQEQANNKYSEEEVLKLLINFSDDRTFLKKDVAIKWFELHKKK